MSIKRVGGFILLVVGVFLLINGMNASESVVDRLSSFFTGHFTDTTTWYIIAGITLVVVGLGLALRGGRRALV